MVAPVVVFIRSPNGALANDFVFPQFSQELMELELKLTQMTQRPMLRVGVCARASQNTKKWSLDGNSLTYRVFVFLELFTQSRGEYGWDAAVLCP